MEMELNTKVSAVKAEDSKNSKSNNLLVYGGGNTDLRGVLKDFTLRQLELLEKEREEEEKQAIDNINRYSAKELEIQGVCMRKLEVVEISTGLYDKYIAKFQKRVKKEENVATRYKFGEGDIVGVYEFDEKIKGKPLCTGIVYQFYKNVVSVAFDEFFEPDELPKNIALVQLCNQVTYERIKKSLENLDALDLNQNNIDLIKVLFGLTEPTEQWEESKSTEFKKSEIEFYSKSLNKYQKEAIEFCLKTKEIGLIHGPPGTGKTTTISEFIVQSVKNGQKLLVLAPSNIAVDNIVEKLLDYKKSGLYTDLNLCRLGHPARFLESSLEVCLDSKIEETNFSKMVRNSKLEIERVSKEISRTKVKTEKKKKLDILFGLRKEIKGFYKQVVSEIYLKSNVILATCNGAADKYLGKILQKLNNRLFDTVVIDECAQATEALCWIGINMGKKLILAGDHLQLPPTIKSKEASSSGLSFTLFDRMMKMYGDKISRLLNIQYRMNEKIMEFSSKELYQGKLIADESVRSHTIIDLLDKSEYEVSNSTVRVYSDTHGFAPESLVLLDTSNYNLYESTDENSLSRFNIGEVYIVKHLIEYLTNIIKLKHEDIGVITPYSAQVNNMKQYDVQGSGESELEISTVDGFQGREKEVIILSLVRSNKRNEVGFLSDERRLNVAITRAKRMVILVCNTKTVSKNPFLKRLCDYFGEKAANLELLEMIDHSTLNEWVLESEKGTNETSATNKDKPKDESDDEEKGKGDGESKKGKGKNKKKKKGGEKNSNDGALKSTNINNPNASVSALSSSSLSSTTQAKPDVNDEAERMIKVLEGKINAFIKDKNSSEFTLPGLTNNERRLMHDYAEKLGLIHESKGDKERVLVFRKKQPAEIKPAESDDIIIESATGVTTSSNSSVLATASSVKLPNNNTGKKNQQTKSSNKAKTDDWDDVEDLLNNLDDDKKKGPCAVPSCLITSKQDKVQCNYCFKWFCDVHKNNWVHVCDTQTKYEYHDSGNQAQKNKLNTKVKELQDARKVKQKKK